MLPLSLHYTASSGDYTSVSFRTVQFTAGNIEQIVDVSTSTDDVGENDETFEAVLSAPSAGLTIRSGEDVATVTITDNTPVLVEFDPTTVTRRENQGTVSFTIVRRTAATGPVSVLFSTAPGSASTLLVTLRNLVCLIYNETRVAGLFN